MNRAAIERLLPWVLRRAARPGTPLLALLQVMEDLHGPSEAVLASVERTFDPYRTPPAFVAYLARWVDLGRLVEERAGEGPRERLADAVEPGRLRELIAAAARLGRWRGTARGLREFLEIATGHTGFVVEEGLLPPKSGQGRGRAADEQPRPFHIRIRAPAGALPHRRLVERIIEIEKPAYVTHETVFGPPPEGDRNPEG